MRSAWTRRTSGPPLMESPAAANGRRTWTQHSGVVSGRAPFGSSDPRAALAHAVVAGRVREIDDVPKESLVGAHRVVGVEILLVEAAVGNGTVHAGIA